MDYKETVGWNCLTQDGFLQPHPVNLDVFEKILSILSICLTCFLLGVV